MLTQPELGIRIALTTDYLSEFLPVLYKTLLILAFPPTHIDTYLDQLVSRSRTEATAKSLTTKLDLTAATNQPEFKADLEALLAEGPEYTSDYSLSMLSSTLTISNCGQEALAQTRVLFSKTLAKKPKKPTRAFKYITNKPNFDDYYQWEDLSFKALPSKKVLNKIKRTNFQLIEQFFDQEKLKLKKLAPLNLLKNLFTDYLNEYLIKNYLRTVIRWPSQSSYLPIPSVEHCLWRNTRPWLRLRFNPFAWTSFSLVLPIFSFLWSNHAKRL